MAMTGRLEADFKAFDSACTATEAKLTSLGASGLRTSGEVAKLALVTEQGVNPLNTLSGSLSQFDSALAAAGVHIGPELRALGEFGAVAGKTTAEVGMLGTAGLVLGAGIAGWKVGRMVSEFFGLDEAIGNATAKLLGFGDVASQEAGAKADVLARATKNAHREITDYSEAILINQRAHEQWKGPVEAAGKLEAFEASLKQTAFEAEHLTMAQKGVVAEALAMGRSTSAIAEAMGLTTDGIELYIEALKATEKAEALAAAEAQKLAGEIPPVAEATKQVTVAAFEMGQAIDDALTPPAGGWALMDSLDAILAKSAAARDSFIDMGHAITNMDGSKGSDRGKGYVRSLSEFDPAVVAMYRKMGLEDWQVLNVLLGVATIYDYQATIDAKKTGGKAGGATASGGGSPPSGPGVLGSPGALAGLAGGAPIVVHNTVTVSGVFDAAAKAALTKVVDEGITSSIMKARRLSVR